MMVVVSRGSTDEVERSSVSCCQVVDGMRVEVVPASPRRGAEADVVVVGRSSCLILLVDVNVPLMCLERFV